MCCISTGQIHTRFGAVRGRSACVPKEALLHQTAAVRLFHAVGECWQEGLAKIPHQLAQAPTRTPTVLGLQSHLES